MLLLPLIAVLATALCAAAEVGPEVGVHDVFPGVGEYYFNGIPGNWSMAFRQCAASGGNLAVINSLAEADALRQILVRHGADVALIGFHDLFIEGDYTFVTGWSVAANTSSESLWAPGAPGGNHGDNCGYFGVAGIFNGPCWAEVPFICELSDDQGGEDNFDGYVLVPGHGYYKLYNTTVIPWPEAWATCRTEHAELLVFDSPEELQALWDAFQGRFQYYYWMGLHRRWGPDDAFLSVHNTPLKDLGYQIWMSDYYTPYETYPYVSMYRNKGMATEKPEAGHRFFCERPLETQAKRWKMGR